MLKLRRSHDRLIFNMAIPNSERRSLYWDGSLGSLIYGICLVQSFAKIVLFANLDKVSHTNGREYDRE